MEINSISYSPGSNGGDHLPSLQNNCFQLGLGSFSVNQKEPNSLWTSPIYLRFIAIAFYQFMSSQTHKDSQLVSYATPPRSSLFNRLVPLIFDVIKSSEWLDSADRVRAHFSSINSENSINFFFKKKKIRKRDQINIAISSNVDNEKALRIAKFDEGNA